MTSDGDQSGARRRRRRRADSAGAGSQAQATPVPGPPASAATGASRREPAPPRAAETKPRRPRHGQTSRDSGERGLRDLVGAGRSQLGVSGALRGRDVNRPSETDLADAEANLVIVRRNWTPPPDDATGQNAR